MRPRRRRPVPSAHQRNIRFLTGLVITLAILGTLLFLWLVNLAANAAR